jgi:hypothetical protein
MAPNQRLKLTAGVCVVALSLAWCFTVLHRPTAQALRKSSSRKLEPGEVIGVHPPEGAPLNTGDVIDRSRRENAMTVLKDLVSDKDEARALALYKERLQNLALGSLPQELNILLDRNYSELQQTLITLLLKRWIDLDPNNALASEIRRGGEDGKYLGELLRDWAAISPENALSWVKASAAILPKGTLPTDPMQAVISSRFSALLLAAIDSKNFQWAISLLEYRPLLGGTSLLVNAWTAADPVAASAWVLSRPTAQRAEALAGFIGNIASTAPDLATDTIRRLRDATERDLAVSSADRALPPSSEKFSQVAWLADLVGNDSDGSYDREIDNFFRRHAVAATDADAARAIVALVRDEFLRCEAAKSVVSSLRGSSPAEAITSAIQFLKNSGEDGTIESIFLSWRQSDSAAATEFVRTNPKIPNSLRSHLVSIAETGKVDR